MSRHDKDNFLERIRRKNNDRLETPEETMRRWGYEDRLLDEADRETKEPQTFGEKIAQKWRDLPRAAKIGIPAGGTALAVGVTGVGLANSEHEETVSPQSLHQGDLNYERGETALKDAAGKPALMNYFTAGEDRVLEVSLASRLPELFREGRAADYLGNIENSARSSTLEVMYVPVTTCSSDGKGNQSCTTTIQAQYYTDYHYYNYPLEMSEDFRPASKAQETEIRAFFEQFTEATGIPVRISYDNPKAHITIANYLNEPDYYRGSLDYVHPGALNSVPPGAMGGGIGLKQGFLVLNDRNGGEANGISNQIAKTLGFESGKANWLALREQLAESGFTVPEVAPGSDIYDLSQDIPRNPLFPDQTIIDSDGRNTLQGSKENDTLVTEAGYCGRIDTPKNKLTNIFGDGKAYCIAEGEFAVVQAGAGNDLIFASRAGHQTIQPGEGNNRVAFFQPEIGDKVILAEGGNDTLLLHDDLISRGNLQVEADGQDVVLHFSAPSGRDLGSIRLIDQLEPGKGIETITVVDDLGKPVFSQGVKDLTAESWAKDVIEPLINQVEKNAQATAQDMAARLGRRNRWTSETLARGANGAGPAL